VKLGIEEENAVLEVLRSGWLTMGAVTQAFEQEFSAFCGRETCFCSHQRDCRAASGVHGCGSGRGR